MTNDDIFQYLASEQFSTQKNWQLPWNMLKREPSVLAVGLLRARLLKCQSPPFNWLFNLTNGNISSLDKRAEE